MVDFYGIQYIGILRKLLVTFSLTGLKYKIEKEKRMTAFVHELTRESDRFNQSADVTFTFFCTVL